MGDDRSWGMGLERRLREARLAMAEATDYSMWREAAEMVDRLEGGEQWRTQDTSDEYDWRLIRSRLRQIRSFRRENAAGKLAHHLRQGLHWNLGNIGNPHLYGRVRVGTKQLIGDYVAEVCGALEWLCEKAVQLVPALLDI